MTLLQAIRHEMGEIRSETQARHLKRFFKTGEGEYGEGDVFLGIKVPELRKLAKKYRKLPIDQITLLLVSTYHEERWLALLMLVNRFSAGNTAEKQLIYDLYLSNTRHINNWDLVDASAQHIVGAFLMEKSKTPLYSLAKSKDMWERRISIMATFYFIKRYSYSETLKIAEILIFDEEDLIHKAVGWMLREVGKRQLEIEEGFLQRHYKHMPRTMLRYAIEKLPETKRKRYLSGEI